MARWSVRQVGVRAWVRRGVHWVAVRDGKGGLFENGGAALRPVCGHACTNVMRAGRILDAFPSFDVGVGVGTWWTPDAPLGSECEWEWFGVLRPPPCFRVGVEVGRSPDAPPLVRSGSRSES